MPRIEKYQPPNPEPKYPFLKWIQDLRKHPEGSYCILFQGKDFPKTTSPRSMCEYLWRHARKHDIKIKVYQGDKEVRFRLEK